MMAYGRHLSWAQLQMMMKGSRHADSMQYQDDMHVFMHAMSSDKIPPEEAEKMMGNFIQEQMKIYCKNKNLRGKDRPAYMGDPDIAPFFNIGMALHAIMDSTSPSHRGFQKWKIKDFHNHGSFPTSEESIITALGFSYTVDTVKKMLQTFDPNKDPCGCGQ